MHRTNDQFQTYPIVDAIVVDATATTSATAAAAATACNSSCLCVILLNDP